MTIEHLVTGPLSVNTWFVPLDSRRLVVVDPGGNADSIIAHVELSGSAAALILLTHGHFDHLAALPELASAWPGVPIAIHPGDAPFLGPGARRRHADFFAKLGAADILDGWPDELPPATALLADGEAVPATGADRWTVLHTPGHSPGSVCLYNTDEGILLSGDTLFRSGFGRTDSPGGSGTALRTSISRLFALPARTRVLPGHGPETTIGREAF